MNFAVFADTPVDVAVIEVGLGGVTDATNVGDGTVSVVCPISLDHTDLLGDTVRDIALEKSGIIKSGGFLVSAAQDPEAAQVQVQRVEGCANPGGDGLHDMVGDHHQHSQRSQQIQVG